MPQPFNYMLPDPSASVMQGVQQSLNIAQVKGQLDFQRQQREANVLEQAEKQRVLEQTKLLQADLALVAKNPSPAAIASLIIKYPQLSEQLKRGYDVQSAERRRAGIQQATQVHAAQLSGNYEMAQRLLLEQAEAYANSGMELEAETARVIAKNMELGPDIALTSTGLMLAAAMEPENYVETFTHLQNEQRNAAKAPAELSEAQSKATKAAVDSGYAEANAVKELEKKGWDIYKIQEDVKIARENARIAAASAGLARESNNLKRQELGLKIDEMKRTRDETIRGQAADAKTAHTNMDNMLNTVDRILQTPIGVLKAAMGPVDSRLPTIQRDVADFEELVDTLSSQITMSRIGEMKGVLSDKDLAVLRSSLQSISLRQSPKRLMENVQEAQRLIIKTRATVADRYGLPATIPDTPAAAGSRRVDDLVNKYAPKSGSTGSW